MTRLLQCGWETGDVAQLGTAVGAGVFAVPAVVSATPTARSGTYCLKCTNSNGSNTGFANSSRITFLHASKTELYYAFGVYRNDTETNTLPSRVAFFTQDTAGNINCLVTFEDDGSCRAYVVTGGGSNPNVTSNLTLIGSSATSIGNNTWTHIEVHIIAATGSTGTFELKINGSTVITATSQRTCQTNANFGGFVLLFMRGQAGGGSTSSYLAFDDLRVNDTSGSVNNTWCGDESILMLKPNAAGDSTQFTRGGADSGNNYGQVDEVPPNALTDYVYDTVTGHTDLYNMTSVTVTSVSAIEVLVQAQNPDGAGGTVNLPIKTASQSDGSAQAVSGQPMYLHRIVEVDPDDSAAWNQSKINSLQAGIKVAS